MIKQVLKNAKFKLLVALSVITSMSSMVFAEAVPLDVAAQIDSVTTVITSSFDVSLIAKVIGAILSAGLGFWILWWAVRKITKGVKSAFAGKDINV